MPNLLWLTSRSKFETGAQNCPMRRHLGDHEGPHGYGWQRKAVSVPLATGTYTDKGISAICQWMIDQAAAAGPSQSAPLQLTQAPDEVIRWAADLAVNQYIQVVNARGVLTMAGGDEASLAKLHLLINEQQTLIEGLIWTWALVRLPAILAEYRLISVQEEGMFVLDCTCGIGDGIGELADHQAKDCGGIGWQSKPDLLAQRWTDGAYAYIEIKTTSQGRRAWDESFERKQQIILGTLGAERRYGVEISHVWIEGLVKGQRRREYNALDTDPKRQGSFLCYGYHRGAVPPLTIDEWMPSYEWYDTDGIKRTTGRGKDALKKVALWECPDDWFPGRPAEMSKIEWWVRYWIEQSPHTIAKALHVIGPIPKRRDMIETAKRAVIGEERLWQDRQWKLYEFRERTGKSWADPEYQEFLDITIPRSYNCDPFGPDHPCPMIPICFKEAGWEFPTGSGAYLYRRPHHAEELVQAKAALAEIGQSLPEVEYGEDEIDPTEDE